MTLRISLGSLSVLAIAFFLACGGSEEPVETAEAPASVESAAPPAQTPAGSFEAALERVATLEARLADQRALHEKAVARAEQARAALASDEKAVAKSQSDLDATSGALKKAERKLAALQPVVPDEQLFREVQSALLESEALSQVAIRAEIEKGTVVLHGAVPDERVREGAERVAKEVPGVRAVDNEIKVVGQPQG